MFLMEALCGSAYAQSGKLSGRVSDAASGETLPGATVALAGTNLGATADVDGRYNVVGITPGTYTVRVSYVGYATQAIELRIVSDRTTDLNVELREQQTEGEEIIVEATRPVVDQNQTTSRALVTGEEMSQLPVVSLQDALSRTSNSYEGFIRGSRRFETRTVLEGVDVSDALNQISPTALGGSYAGSTYNNVNRSDQTNASLFAFNPEGIEEVTVNTGATEASYGAASGGVIAVTLADGRGPLRGSLSFRGASSVLRPGPDSLGFYDDVDRYLTEGFKVDSTYRAKLAAGVPKAQYRADSIKSTLYTFTPDRYSIGGEPELDTRFTLGGSILKNWTFFTTGQFFQTNGYQPNQYAKRNYLQLKTSFSITPTTKLTGIAIGEDRGLGILGIGGGWNNKSYNDFWRFYLEGVAQNDGASSLGSLRLTQVLSQKAFADLQVYSTWKRTRYGYVDDDGNGFTDPGEDGDFLDLTNPEVADRYVGRGADVSKMFHENISDPNSDTGIFLPNGNRYKAARPSPYSEDATQRTVGVRANVSGQVTPNHFVQTGAEVRFRRFDYTQVQGLDQTGAKLNSVLEPFQVSDWSRSPTEVGLYLSDRIEYAGLKVNLGLRAEIINRDMEQIKDYFRPFRRDTVLIGEGTAAARRVPRNVFNRGGDVPLDFFLNPSLGVSHPIGTKASMYFSYARTRQLLPYTTLYSNYDGNSSNSVSFVYQDPRQDPITSNNYELGAQWEFAPGWGVDANAYMRSIENYGQAAFTANRPAVAGQPAVPGVLGAVTHVYATSAGYADVRGIELVLRRAPLRLRRDLRLGLTTTYTFSSVETSNYAGVNVNGFSDVAGGQVTQIPFNNADDFKNFPQNVRGGASTLTGGFDRTHRLTLRSIATLPFGVQLGVTGNLESGFLYPRAVGVDPRDRDLLTGPTNYRIDARVEKRFRFTNRFGLDLFADMTNITDRLNVVAYESFTPLGPSIFQETGNPGSRLILQDGTAIYGPARTVYFGSRLRF